ncbi:hypothetical protein AJ79_08230 [Helicocarpus griseus UAMH5409]|uniref:Uncharacterized protein n=1 Tax=Helicocarpus griseus UAMH5409 TaxID=1447875 RepID=A0A2B7WVB0_9EURO|nr:hypothetical protein AJ79_08230 [Helicocarpus griseus UAMH5409]
MAGITHEPLSGPKEFSSLMPGLFSLYARGSDDQLSFRFLQRTPDLGVACGECIAEDIDFPTSPALENAIQNSARIDSPKSGRYPPVRDSYWATWLEGTISDLAREIEIPRGEHPPGGPLLDTLTFGVPMVNYRPRCRGLCLFRHRPDHWAYMILDYSQMDGEDRNGKDHILRGEILAATAIFYNQMNEFRWDCYQERYLKPDLKYKGGPLTPTIVNFMDKKVRVVQATCNPSEEYPTLAFTLRGLYDVDLSHYNKTTVQKVVKWIMCPPNPVYALSLRVKNV